MTFSQGTPHPPRRSSRMQSSLVTPSYTGTDLWLRKLTIDHNLLRDLPPPVDKTMAIAQFPIRKLLGNKMLDHYNTVTGGLDSPYLNKTIDSRELPDFIGTPFLRSMSKQSLTIVRNWTMRANDEILDMYNLLCSRNDHMSPDFVALPACNYTNFLRLRKQHLTQDEYASAVRREINSGYHGNKRRPDGVLDLLSIGCIVLDIQANDHWTKVFVCFPNSGRVDVDQESMSALPCIWHLDSTEQCNIYRPDHCSLMVANDVLEMLNLYKDDDIPKLTNIMFPVIRLPCKLVTNFIEQKYSNVFLIFSHTNIIFILRFNIL
jgi:hypothetical protein